jgi:hypothetical protein
MLRRRRIAVAENAIRGIIGRPQLVPTGQPAAGIVYEKTGTLAVGTRLSGTPAVLRLGPVVVRTSATMELSVIHADGSTEVTVPATPERQAAAFATVIASTTFGVVIADYTTNGLGYIIIGALAGWYSGARLWNHWVRESAANRASK